MKMQALVLLVASILWSAPLAAETALPAGALPPGFLAGDGSAGGRIVYGTPHAADTSAAMKAGLRAADAYFGGTLTIDAIVQHTRGSAPAMTAWFRAALHGTPVAGLAIAAIDPHGGPRVALLFDRADRIARSLPALSNDLAANGGPQAAASGPLRTMRANDGSMSIGLPPGWTANMMEHGNFSVTGPDGARVASFPITVASPMDRYLVGAPHAAYIADPAQAFVTVRRAMVRPGEPDPDVRIERTRPLQVPSFIPAGTHASVVVGTLTTPQGRRRFGSVIGTVPPSQPNGPWLLSLVAFSSAPPERYAADLPTMLAIANSVALNGKVLQEQNKQISDAIAATSAQIIGSAGTFRANQQHKFDASMASARQAQDSIDRSTAGFVHYLSDQSVVNQASTGAHGTMGNALARTLVNAQPNEYSIVPLNRYRKGVDY